VLRTPRVLAGARGCKASEYVVFDAEDEPPGASADGAASGFDSITHTRLACDVSDDVSATRHARRHTVSTVE
jgi:hypothetical protein